MQSWPAARPRQRPSMEARGDLVVRVLPFFASTPVDAANGADASENNKAQPTVGEALQSAAEPSYGILGLDEGRV